MDSERQATTRVFISATSGDLASVREIVKQGLLTMHCLPVEQTNFGPDYRTVTQMLEARIGGCDAVVHIVGLRYGAEPDPATLPAGTARRSYTQLEADIARRLKKKLFVFVCPEDFPFDAGEPEAEEIAALQRAYREEVGRSPTLRTQVATREEVAQRVRELQVDLEKVRQQLATERRRRLIFTTIVALLLAGLGIGVWWNSRHTLKVVASIAQDYDPERIEANLRKQIRQRAEEETRKLDAVKDWPKVIEIEKARDQQLADVDRLLEQMHQAYAKQEVSANYALASKILAEKGVEETLQFLAAKNAERQERIAALKRQSNAVESELRKVLREKLLTASLLEKNFQFEKAADEYRAMVADDPRWPEPQLILARLLVQLEEIVDPTKGTALLAEAEDLARKALALTSRTNSPQDWATAQDHLGSALLGQSERTAGRRGQELLDEAAAAFREALTIRTRTAMPNDWAQTEEALGLAINEQGKREAGAEGERLLGEAADIDRAVLEVFTREQRPEEWATTECNLASVLRDRGERVAGAEAQRLLGESAAASRAALQFYTLERSALTWANAQDSLGNALWEQGKRADGDEARRLLREAIAAYLEALRVRTQERMPLDWAATQDNLANALADLARQANDRDAESLLEKSVAAHRAALKVYTREQAPLDWAMAQDNLGTALLDQGGRAEGAEARRLLEEASAAFREALKVYTPEHFPLDWAHAEINLGNVLAAQAEGAEGPQGSRLFGEAVAVYGEALKVFHREELPQDWARAQFNVGTALLKQSLQAGSGTTGGDDEKPRLLGAAVAAFRAALQVFTREQLPGAWASTENNLSIALKHLAQATGGDEGKKLQAEAEGIDREVAAAEGK